MREIAYSFKNLRLALKILPWGEKGHVTSITTKCGLRFILEGNHLDLLCKAYNQNGIAGVFDYFFDHSEKAHYLNDHMRSLEAMPDVFGKKNDLKKLVTEEVHQKYQSFNNEEVPSWIN